MSEQDKSKMSEDELENFPIHFVPTMVSEIRQFIILVHGWTSLIQEELSEPIKLTDMHTIQDVMAAFESDSAQVAKLLDTALEYATEYRIRKARQPGCPKTKQSTN